MKTKLECNIEVSSLNISQIIRDYFSPVNKDKENSFKHFTMCMIARLEEKLEQAYRDIEYERKSVKHLMEELEKSKEREAILMEAVNKTKTRFMGGDYLAAESVIDNVLEKLKIIS